MPPIDWRHVISFIFLSISIVMPRFCLWSWFGTLVVGRPHRLEHGRLFRRMVAGVCGDLLNTTSNRQVRFILKIRSWWADTVKWNLPTIDLVSAYIINAADQQSLVSVNIFHHHHHHICWSYVIASVYSFVYFGVALEFFFLLAIERITFCVCVCICCWSFITMIMFFFFRFLLLPFFFFALFLHWNNGGKRCTQKEKKTRGNGRALAAPCSLPRTCKVELVFYLPSSSLFLFFFFSLFCRESFLFLLHLEKRKTLPISAL